MTKTELALLAEAARSPGKTVGVEHGYSGPSGRKRPFGVRRHAAAVSLMKKGLLERVSSDGGTPLYTPGYGVSGYSFLSVWRLK